MPKPRLYLDSCIFIDMAKVALGIGSASLEQERLEDIWFARRLCDAARDGAIQIFTSTLTVAECQHVDQQITDQVKDLLARAGLHMIRPSETQSLPNEYRQGDMLAGQPSEA